MTSDRSSNHFHAVRFYEASRSLARVAAGFLAEGLVADQRGVIVARPEHRRAIVGCLAERSIDVDRVLQTAALIAVDAHEALATVMVKGMPDPNAIESAVSLLVGKAAGGRAGRSIRWYGELADVLWAQGKEAEAIRLEIFADHALMKRNVRTLCGYSMKNSYKAASFERICRVHTHVVSADGVAAEIGPGGVI